MIATHEAEVAFRFDALHSGSNLRLPGRLPPAGDRGRAGAPAGKRILDLGCGKGRFAGPSVARAPKVVGLDLSAAMLAEATGLPRVRATARRLPSGPGRSTRSLR